MLGKFPKIENFIMIDRKNITFKKPSLSSNTLYPSSGNTTGVAASFCNKNVADFATCC